MCQTGPDSISIDENVDLLAAKAITDKYNVALGGNIPLTTVMLHGTQQDNMKFVIDLLDNMPNKKNFILAPGCDMPYAVPVENTIGVVQAIHEPDSVREILKNYVAADEDIENRTAGLRASGETAGRSIYTGFCNMCGMYVYDGRCQ